MKKEIYVSVVLVFICILSANSQGIWVNFGGIYINESTKFILNDTDLNSKSDFHSLDQSEIILQSENHSITLRGNLIFRNLFVDGSCELYTDLDVNGNIYFNSGVLDLLDNNIRLGGELLNENKLSRAFSSGIGLIVKRMILNSGEKLNPGNMGINIIVSKDYGEVEIRRGHKSLLNGSNKSIFRNFSFDTSLDLSQIEFTYLDLELNSLDERTLKIATKYIDVWTFHKSFYDLSNEFLGENFSLVESITLFSNNENTGVEFPTGFSPNGDGVNDYFVIKNVQNYSNNKLIIFNQWGDIVFEAVSYLNNWDGKSSNGVTISGDKYLKSGTYFYFFYYDKDKAGELYKGFLEIKRK